MVEAKPSREKNVRKVLKNCMVGDDGGSLGGGVKAEKRAYRFVLPTNCFAQTPIHRMQLPVFQSSDIL